MLEEPATPRAARDAALAELTREDLELYAVKDLEERINLLEQEIVRSRAAIDRKKNGRAAADALFSSGRG